MKHVLHVGSIQDTPRVDSFIANFCFHEIKFP
jgi:hypothetical protein